MSESSKKHAELKGLAKQSKENIWKMLKLTDEILSDHEYVDQFGGEAGLIEALQNNEFAHFGGSPSVPELLRAFRANPRKAKWAEYQYNVWAMIDLARPEPETSATERTNWKKLAQELQLKVETLEAALRESNTERARLEGRILQLEKGKAA